MTSVVLYKDCKANGTTRLTGYTTLAKQKAYFDGLTKLTLNVPTFKLGEPFKVDKSIKTLSQYNYMHIDYGDGFRFYCYITDYDFITTSQTAIIYTVDAYETAYRQTEMKIARAEVSRIATVEEGMKEVAASEPLSLDRRAVVRFGPSGTLQPLIAYVRRDSEANKIYYGYIQYCPLEYATNGAWITEIIGCLESDIRIAGVVAMAPAVSGWTKYSKEVGQYTITYYETDNGRAANANLASLGIQTITASIYKGYQVLDLRGTPVYTFRLNEQVDLSEIVWYMAYSASSISVRGEVTYPASGLRETIVIPSELVDVYADEWNEYYYRQRESDIQSRKDQVAQSTVSGLASVGLSTVSGAAVGSVIPGIGTVVGAIGGLALGVLGVGITSGIQSHYGKSSQATADQTYKRANDSLIQTGNYHPTMGLSGIYSTEWDDVSATMCNYDINANGHYVVGVTSYPDGLPLGAFRGDCEILGSIPNNWKLQIEQRLSQGVLVV